jgi:hypothetical protein
MLITAREALVLLKEAVAARDAANVLLLSADDVEWDVARHAYRVAYDRARHLARALSDVATETAGTRYRVDGQVYAGEGPVYAEPPEIGDRHVFVEDEEPRP